MPTDLDTVWSRDEVDRKPGALSRAAIVAAAIAIADDNGLEAVSIRHLAGKLDARPMSLYSHIERKGDLVDLMIDEVMGGAIIAGEVPDDWREALRQIAGRTRAVARAHPWMIALAFRRPRLGPNALRHIDQSLAAVARLDLAPGRKRAALLAVDSYTLGFVRWEVLTPIPDGRCGADADDGPTAEEIDAYITAQAETGDYPHISELAGEDLTLGVAAENFEVGLEWLLAGIEAEVGQA